MRDVDDLEANAVKFWPRALSARDRDSSILPRLLETQEKFIGLLYVADASYDAWKPVSNKPTDFPATCS
jgi:hypothetical protein